MTPIVLIDPDPDDLDVLLPALLFEAVVRVRRGRRQFRRVAITTGKEQTGAGGRETSCIPPEFEERVMVTIHEFNAAATVYLADYASRALFSRRDTGRRMSATEEAVAHSRALMVQVDALIAKLIPKGWLWPAY
jgi:hypothetical protein